MKKYYGLDSMVAYFVLVFCENLAELGCPEKEKNPDMWFRYLSPKEQIKVSKKLLDIHKRNLGNLKKTKKRKAK